MKDQTLYSYGPYDLCAAYDPYCFAPYWYTAPIYYLSRRDETTTAMVTAARALARGSVINRSGNKRELEAVHR